MAETYFGFLPYEKVVGIYQGTNPEAVGFAYAWTEGNPVQVHQRIFLPPSAWMDQTMTLKLAPYPYSAVKTTQAWVNTIAGKSFPNVGPFARYGRATVVVAAPLALDREPTEDERTCHDNGWYQVLMRTGTGPYVDFGRLEACRTATVAGAMFTVREGWRFTRPLTSDDWDSGTFTILRLGDPTTEFSQLAATAGSFPKVSTDDVSYSRYKPTQTNP